VKVLIAEDEEVSRHILRETLTRWGYDVVTAGDGTEAWRLLQEKDAPRLVILDWIMPGKDGIEICRMIRAELKEPYIYILLLTAKGRREDILLGMGAGADDYILKPFDVQELRMRLSAGQRIIDLQAQLLETRESLRYLATHDSLTGLSNRAEVLDRLRQELDRSSRESSNLGLVMADIDHFKDINDSLGHAAGDVVLAEVAGRMRGASRSYDVIGRYGGEEFLIILPGCDEANALRQAERIRTVLTDQAVALPQGSVSVTLSLGVAAREKGGIGDVQSLIRAADAALYRAKSGGRNRVAVASSGCSPLEVAT
jgi:diguanylate cyclase (GGDEF)-like protein